MEDKRIKLITIEMFIAWGMICTLFFMLDLFYLNSGIIAFSTRMSPTGLSLSGIRVFLIVMFSNLPATLVSQSISNMLGLINAPKFIIIITFVLLFIVTQILLWGYLGNLFGSFIVLVKQLFLKKTSGQKNSDGN
jgi:hypothetical protein